MMTHTASFVESQSLRGIFAETKKLRPTRSPAHVLVVEDDPWTRRAVVNALGKAHAMITEGNAHGAVASYLLHAPDVVFLDIGLPDADGFAVLDQIMTVDPEAFVVMFSSHTDPRTIDKAVAAGAKGYVTKPFHKETLLHYVQGGNIHHHKPRI